MIRYNYLTEKNDNGVYIKIEKIPIIEYPDFDINLLDLEIYNTEELNDLLILKDLGKQEKKLLLIEDKWYELMIAFINYNNIKIDLEKKIYDNNDKINNNITDGLLTNIEILNINKKITETNLNIDDSFNLVLKLEDKYKWLIEFRVVNNLTEKTSVRPVFKSNLLISDKKKIIRHGIDKKVRDVNDTVADLSKMNALLMAMISGIYSVISEDEKNLLDPSKRGLIEYGIAEWDKSSTRADRQLQKEGTKLINRLFSREVKIADIVDKYS